MPQVSCDCSFLPTSFHLSTSDLYSLNEDRQLTLAPFVTTPLCFVGAQSETYTNYFGKSPYERIKVSNLDLSKLPIEGLTQLECGGQGADIDTAWNEVQTPNVARLAAGCVIEAATSVADGKLLNAFAVVRPPGKCLGAR